MVLRKWVIPIALAIVGVFVGFHLSGLEGNGVQFFQYRGGGWVLVTENLGDPKVVAKILNSIEEWRDWDGIPDYKIGFVFLGIHLPGHAAIWTFGIPIAFGVLGFFIPQVLFKTGNSHRNGSSREEQDVEEELTRINDLHAKGSITDEEQEKMRKNVLGI